MKILYLCNYYHRAMIFRDSMNYLEKLGHELLAFNSVVIGAKVDSKYTHIMDEKVVHCECFNSYDRYNYFGKQHKIEKQLLKSVNVSDYEVIHSHTLFNGGWVARQIYKKIGIPYVVSIRNTDLNDYLKIPVFKWIARRIVDDANCVQFLSEAYRKKFIDICYKKHPNRVMEKSVVITNGLEAFWIDNIYHAKRDVKNKKIRVICVGKIDRNKNMKAVLEAVKILVSKGYTIETTLIGQVVDSEIDELLKQYENVQILPFMKKEELIKYYRSSDIYVMPSITESFGRVYAEAMTQGLPVVFTRGQGFDGQFIEGEIGYSVNPNDYNEIAEKIEMIYKDYGSISKRCLEECSRFDWNSIVVKLDEMYSKACAK